jgi:hypothetical protein
MDDIARPRQPGYYHGRLTDCKRALTSAVDELLVKAAGLRLDRELISRQLTPPASRAGWGEIEVIVAVSMLVKCEPKSPSETRRKNM